MLNFVGPEPGKGFRVFYDGIELESFDSSLKGVDLSSSPGDGRVVVGRYYTDQDRDYISVEIDELIFFNQALNNDNINTLYSGK